MYKWLDVSSLQAQLLIKVLWRYASMDGLLVFF
jgi:hypothetical protein